MALESFIAGHYTSTYNAVDLGVMEEGFDLQQESRHEVINRSDAYGDSAIEMIYRGGDVHLQFTSLEYVAGAIDAFWPHEDLGVMRSAANPIGRLASDIASALVLTSVAATPAVASPASLTGTKAVLAENFPARLLFDSRLRKVPVRMRFIPYDATGDTIWFATT